MRSSDCKSVKQEQKDIWFINWEINVTLGDT